MNHDQQRAETQLQLEKLRTLGPLSLAETCKAVGVRRSKATVLRAMLRKERQEPTGEERFQQRLASFRLMDDKRRSTVCEAMQISQKTHLRLLAEIRKETGTLTKAERFREIIVMVRDWIGDSDPKKLSLMAAAKALDISTNQAARARDAIVRERLQAVAEVKAVAEPKPEPKPKVRRPHRWHDGLTLRWWPVPAGKRRVRLVVTEANEFDFAEVGA